MQDTKIGRCYHGVEGASFTLFHLCHKVVLFQGEWGGKGLIFKGIWSFIFFFKAYILMSATEWLYVGLPCGACNPQARSVTLLTVKLLSLLNHSANPAIEEEVKPAAMCLSFSALGGENSNSGLDTLDYSSNARQSQLTRKPSVARVDSLCAVTPEQEELRVCPMACWTPDWDGCLWTTLVCSVVQTGGILARGFICRGKLEGASLFQL